MANFLNEILHTASEVEEKDLQDTVTSIVKNLSNLRFKVEKYLNNSHINVQNLGKPTELIASADGINSNCVELRKRLDDHTKIEISKLSKEIKEHVDSLKESEMSISIIKSLLEVDVHWNAMRKEWKENNHLVAAHHYKSALDLLSEDEYLEYITVVEFLRKKLSVMFVSLSSKAQEFWYDSVYWNYCDIGSNIQTCTLTIKGSIDEIASLMGALNLYGKSSLLVYNFSQSLFNKILHPCIQYKTKVITKMNRNEKIISMTSETDNNSCFQEVLNNLREIFIFIRDTLDFDVGTNLDDDGDDKNPSFIRQIGYQIENDLLTCLVEDCLKNAIPMKKSALQEYDRQIQNTIDLQTLLIDIGFLVEKSQLLEKYCGNVNDQFKNRTIERYYLRAREIYKKPLQDKIQVEMQLKKQNKTTVGESLIKLDVSELSSCLKMDNLCSNMTQFPKCYISNSTEELVELGKEIIRDVFSSGDFDPAIFFAARNIFSLYHEIVPKIHENLLDNLAEQSALFYDNCWYLAHKLITINEEFRGTLPHGVRPQMACLVDLAHPLMSQGTHVLDQQVIKQSNVISKIVNESGLDSLSNLEKLPPTTEKSMRQCLHQLSYLKSVWGEVLPVSIYCQIIGSMASSFLNEVISKVVIVSDIGIEIASSLDQIFSNVHESIPKLFPDPVEVLLHVKMWSKFNELSFIIGANMVQISERWADGKGPLASVFTPCEVQQLIRALFQVSDRRAALLSRIKK